MTPTVKYDHDHGTLSIRLSDAPFAGTDMYDDVHYVDLDADDGVIRLEILDVGDHKLGEITDEYGISDQLPAILIALVKAGVPGVATPTAEISYAMYAELSQRAARSAAKAADAGPVARKTGKTLALTAPVG